MPAPISRAACLLSATLALVLLAAPAYAADAPFAPRFAQTARGDIAAVGNTLMTCPGSCAAAQSGTTADDNDYVMARVNVDNDGTNFDSSSASVSLPAGSTVLWAGLYWAADVSAGTSGAAAPTPANKGTVRFRGPSGGYQTVTAAPADVLTSSAQPNRYRAYADVTSLVASGGTYTVGNVQAGTGNDRFAGWALFVAYRDNAQNIRRLNVYDGLGTVDASHTFTTTIAPFHTPAAPAPVTTKVGLLSFEGDAGLATETATFNGNNLTDALNPANNAMNSTIEAAGTRFSAKSPDYVNQLGMDLDVFANGGALANDQSSATLAFSSTSEYFMPSAFFLVSDEGPATSTAAPAVGGTAADGVTLTANPGTWNGTGPLTYTYQWQRCDAGGNNCVDVAGATQSTYTPGTTDIGKTIRVIVTATNDAGSSTPVVSAATAVTVPSPPASTTPPTVPSTAVKGQTLTAGNGTWAGTGPMTYGYQWQRCTAAGTGCQDIAGATQSTYTPSAGDVGGTVRLVVTATNVAGSSSTASAPVAVSPPPPPDNTDAPVVSGTAAQGQALSAAPGMWTGAGSNYSFQWQRCDADGDNCVDIPGATTSAYTPGADDAGSRIRVVVTATNDEGSTAAVSAPSAIVPGATTTDLGSLPGSLVGETSCQQLVGGAKYRRVALAGIGTVRVRAYATGPARESSPVQLTTEVTGGHATSVRYAIDGRAVAARGGARHAATLTPAQLGKVGGHTLRTTVRGRRGTARFVTLKLTTAPCQTLFTAQRWATTAGAGLRLRVDSRTALTGLAFAVPAALLPKQTGARRTIGFLRLYVAGRRTPLRVNLALPKRGRAAVLLGAPTVTRTRRGLQVRELPAGTAVAELTLYRVTKLDAATPARVFAVKATVQRAGAAAQSFSARPKPTR